MSGNMSNVYARVGVVIVAIIAAAAVASVNMQTTLGQQKGSSATDSIIMKINLRPREDPGLAKDGYYQIGTWYMNASKGSRVCPSGNCQYSIEKAEFRPNIYTIGEYVFEGLLKVSVVNNDTINSKFYPLRAELDKTAAQERNGQTTEFLEGSIDFGKNTFSPDFAYKVDNGTLLVNPSAPLLTLQGVNRGETIKLLQP